MSESFASYKPANPQPLGLSFPRKWIPFIFRMIEALVLWITCLFVVLFISLSLRPSKTKYLGERQYLIHLFILITLMFLKILFIYLTEREPESPSWGRREGRGRSRLPTEQGAGCRAPSQDPGVMTWAKGRCLTDWATQAPLITLISCPTLGGDASQIVVSDEDANFYLHSVSCPSTHKSHSAWRSSPTDSYSVYCFYFSSGHLIIQFVYIYLIALCVHILYLIQAVVIFLSKPGSHLLSHFSPPLGKAFFFVHLIRMKWAGKEMMWKHMDAFCVHISENMICRSDGFGSNKEKETYRDFIELYIRISCLNSCIHYLNENVENTQERWNETGKDKKEKPQVWLEKAETCGGQIWPLAVNNLGPSLLPHSWWDLGK